MDSDIGTQAVLAVTLGADFLLDQACGVSDALRYLAGASLELLITAFCHPDLDVVSLVLAVRARQPGCPVFVMTESTQADAMRELMVLGVEGVFAKPLRLDALLERTVTLLRPQRRSRRLSLHVTRAIQRLCADQTNIANVRELAQAIGVSVSHLAHLFVIDTGMSAKEYLTRVRIESAKRLLLLTDRKLDRVATELGFCDASHLSRVFRQQTGSRPGEFRRNAQIA